ncbi:GDSL esterase/lipase At4g01130-like [Triticum dicoccoides]|uniref:GDSL esterase/lipase At4g01130-like n=1 Tax=Triticum dicoccoides TaxID=85692 RepID=UPI0018915662|nr:GDSL esterase/lipase At4g01130-like [Triticum dicoccoides]
MESGAVQCVCQLRVWRISPTAKIGVSQSFYTVRYFSHVLRPPAPAPLYKHGKLGHAQHDNAAVCSLARGFAPRDEDSVGVAAAPAGCCIGGTAGEGWRCRFPAVFNLGDSNSDTGGFWAAFPAQPPPFGVTYFGRLVIDFITQAMGLPLLSPYLQSVGSDFATLASTALPPNTSPFSLAIQLRQMKELSSRAIASDDASGQLPPPGVLRDSLYTIDIGQNDFTSNLASQGIERIKRTLPSSVSSNIASATACGDPQNYVSWDGIHATEAANNIIASAVMSGAFSYPPSGLSKLCQP